MSVFVLVNIGLRDVLLDGQKQEPAREKGAEIFGNYEAQKDALSFPILMPPLTQILAEEGQIDHLILFGTDQLDERHQTMDTIYFAKIVERAMPEKFAQVRTASSVPIHGINPSLYDEALDFFREELPRLRLPITDESKVYLLPTAGTPACSLGLILQGLTLYGERCHILYQRHFMKEAAPKALPIGVRLQETFQRQTAVHLLHQYNFQAAAQACQSANMQNPLVDHLLAYATARLWFSFIEAAAALSAAIPLARGAQRDSLESAKAELDALLAEEPEALLRELFVNARIAWENGRWLDFLTRCVRFQQMALPLVVAKMPANTFVPPEIQEKLAMPGMSEIIIGQMVHAVENTAPEHLAASQQKALSRLMQDSFNKGELRSLCFDLAINYENIEGHTLESQVISLIQYCQRRNQFFKLVHKIKEERPEKAEKSPSFFGSEETVVQMVRALQRLAALYPIYEQTILTTGSSGVTQSILAQAYQEFQAEKLGFEPVDDMAILCGALGIRTQNPFRIIKEIIVGELQK